MTTDIAEAVRWYLALTTVGIGGLLPTALIFDRLRSGGVLYARPVSMLLLTYAVWIISTLGIAPYGTGVIRLVTMLLFIWSGIIIWRRPMVFRTLLTHRTLLLTGEVLFVAIFALALIVRAQAPAAQHTEKPMDMAVLTAVHETTEFPPKDPWFAGRHVSYYYFGHTTVDVTARLAGSSVAKAFTLGVAATGAMAGIAVFALAGDLVSLSARRRSSALIAGIVALSSFLFAATLVGPIDILAANGIGGTAAWSWLGVQGLANAGSATNGIPDEWWWWWRATRIVPGTITEFPAFSLILGDLHAHLLALPISVVALALSTRTFQEPSAPTWRDWRFQWESLIICGLLYAGLVMTNSWDAILHGSIWFAVATVTHMKDARSIIISGLRALSYLAPVAMVALIGSTPFLRSLEGGFRGLELVTSSPSDPMRLALVWLPLALPLSVATVLIRPRISFSVFIRTVSLAAILPLAWIVAAVLSGQPDSISERGSGWIVLAALVLLTGASGGIFVAALRHGNLGHAAWSGLVTLVVVLLMITELIQVAVAFGPRWNTVFKFWFGAWMLLSIAGGVAVAMSFERSLKYRLTPIALVTIIICVLVYGSSLLYGPAAAISRSREGQSPGLDSLAYLYQHDPGQAATLDWVRTHLNPSNTVLEAVGPPYTRANFLSAASGIPTLLGWPAHQCQFRGDPNECRALGETQEIAERRSAVELIYREGANEQIRSFALSWGITHVYLGLEERRQFGSNIAERFTSWPTKFEKAGSIIVEIPQR